MTDAEQREAARQFVNRWMGKGKEDEDGRSYWIDLLTNVLGMDNVTERLNFEKKVVIDGNTKRIDVYIPETRVIIEQKSLGKALDQKIRNSGDVDLTPFEQADRYNGKLTFDERARWIVTSNFAEIWIYDMNQKQPEPTKIALDELQSKYPLLDFLVKKEVKTISHEMEVSIKAGGIVGLIYDAFLKQYRMAWMRAVCGRLKSDYSYSNTIVYNNFPWPVVTEKNREQIEKSAQEILKARTLYPNSNLAALYDPLTMPAELRRAHTANDKAVMAAYGFSTKMTEADCVGELMKLYQKMQ